MRTTILFLLVALGFTLGAFAEPGRGDDGPGPVKASFAGAVATAEAAWREDALAALRAYGSRLLDAERAATRAEDLTAATSTRDLRRSVERLVAEAAAFESLVGLLPVPGRDGLKGPAEDAFAVCRETMDAANGRYREALKVALEAAAEELHRLMGPATDEADLDRANALVAGGREIRDEVNLRLTPLTWRVITFPTEDVIRLGGADVEWRVEGDELVTSRFPGDPHLDAVVATWFDRIESVTVRGRIRAPYTTNFRLTVGPVGMILNTDLGPVSFFRRFETVDRVGERIVPGRFTEITVRQTSSDRTDVLLDGRLVWSTEHGLYGTITFCPWLSAIGVTDIRILGVPDPDRKVEGPLIRNS